MNSIERFTGRAQTYNSYRLRYPNALILDRLKTWCGLQPDWPIADIGAGTGMLSEAFLSNGNPVVAVEPNEEMRASCMGLLTQWPLLELRDGTAEATGLYDNSVAVVAAGRAFHWFDIPRTLAEFQRVLRPRGWLVLVSIGNTKDDSPRSTDFERLLTNGGLDYSHVSAAYRVHETLGEILVADRHHEQIPGEQKLDWDTFLGQTLSLSVAPHPEDPRSPMFIQNLRDYFQTYAIDGIFTIPTACWIDAGRISTQ